MPLYIAPICTDKWVGKSMGCHCRSKITTNTDTCACMHILNQWELHSVHPKQKTALKMSMLSLKPKSILHNSVVGLACIMYQSSSTLSLKVYIYRRPVCGFPWGENEPNKRDTLKELKNKGGRQAKEFGQGHFACFSAFQTRFALPATKLLPLCSSDLTYLRASRWSRCLQHDWSGPPTDCFQLEVRSNFNQRPHIIWAPDLP
jgi:hypothetical protein